MRSETGRRSGCREKSGQGWPWWCFEVKAYALAISPAKRRSRTIAPLLDRTRQQRLPRGGRWLQRGMRLGYARSIGGRGTGVAGGGRGARRSGRWCHALPCDRGWRAAGRLVGVGCHVVGPGHFATGGCVNLCAGQLRRVGVRGKQGRVRAIINRRRGKRRASQQQHCQPQRRVLHAAPGISAC